MEPPQKGSITIRGPDGEPAEPGVVDLAGRPAKRQPTAWEKRKIEDRRGRFRTRTLQQGKPRLRGTSLDGLEYYGGKDGAIRRKVPKVLKGKAARKAAKRARRRG